MRSSSSWRNEVQDPSVDIFGNKKRWGGGDPLKNERGHTITNTSAVSRYQALQERLATSSSNNNLLSKDTSLPSPLDIHSNNNPKNRNIAEMTADEQFRVDLYQQIEEQKKAKYMAKLKEMEAERAEQERVKREIAALRQKHAAEIQHEQGDGAGFLRFSNSHSHIPQEVKAKVSVHSRPVEVSKPIAPITNTRNVPTKLSTLPSFGEVSIKKEIQNQKDEDKVSLSRLSELVQAMKPIAAPIVTAPPITTVNPTTTTSTNHRDTRSMELLERQVIEQELELKRIRLQMLEQQNDQRTTLQYLLKLQTDFSDKLQESNYQNVSKIRRPLSGITRAPPTPDLLAQHQQSQLGMLRHLQSQSAAQLHHAVGPGISRVDSPLQSFDAQNRASHGTVGYVPGITRVKSPLHPNPNLMNDLNQINNVRDSRNMQDVGASVISLSALKQIQQPPSSYFPQRPIEREIPIAKLPINPQANVSLPVTHPMDHQTPSQPKQVMRNRQIQRPEVSPPIQSKYIQNLEVMDHQHQSTGSTAKQSRIPSQDSSPHRPLQQQQQQLQPRQVQQINNQQKSHVNISSGYVTPRQFGQNKSPQPLSSQISIASTPQRFQVHSIHSTSNQLPSQQLQSQPVSRYVSPPKQVITEQKEESFILLDSQSNPPSTRMKVKDELQSESTFLVVDEYSDDEPVQEKVSEHILDSNPIPIALDQNQAMKHGMNNALSSSTQFELSSRPTTAIPQDVIRKFGERISSKQNAKDSMVRCSIATDSNITDLSYSSFNPPNDVNGDVEDDDPFAVHVVVEDSMQCVSPPMDSKTVHEVNGVNDSVMTVHETSSHSSDCDHDEEREEKDGFRELEVTQGILIMDDEDDHHHQDAVKEEEEEEWKRISKMDRDKVASLRDAFAELSKEGGDVEVEDEEFPVTVVDEQRDGMDNDESIKMEVGIASTDNRTPQKGMEEFVVQHAECKEQDEESDVEYEEDFEEEEPDSKKGKGHGIIRIPELDSSINNFQSKIYSVYSSFDDTMMTTSVASSSDLSQSPQRLKAACETICE